MAEPHVDFAPVIGRDRTGHYVYWCGYRARLNWEVIDSFSMDGELIEGYWSGLVEGFPSEVEAFVQGESLESAANDLRDSVIFLKAELEANYGEDVELPGPVPPPFFR